MSTRCLIGKENKDKTVTYIYCHHDGYPSWVGKTLFENYKDEETINKLLTLGDLSSLGREPIAREYIYTDPKDERERYCDAYSLRGEDSPADTVEDEKKFLSVKVSEEYWYLFKEGKWYYSSDGTTFNELTKDIIARD